jgi:hypothetical protein
MELGARRSESMAPTHHGRRLHAAKSRHRFPPLAALRRVERAHAEIRARPSRDEPGRAIGSDGGTAGPIEFVGVSALNGTQPVPTRTLTPDAWHTLDFPIPDEPVKNFVGNGVLESTTGLGVLEHLAIVPGSASVDHDVYLDNFVVVENNYLTYALTNGPAGATIDPLTGVIAWDAHRRPGGCQLHLHRHRDDAATPPTTASTSFTVAARSISGAPRNHAHRRQFHLFLESGTRRKIRRRKRARCDRSVGLRHRSDRRRRQRRPFRAHWRRTAILPREIEMSQDAHSA